MTVNKDNWTFGNIAFGSYTLSADDATAGTVSIPSGIVAPTSVIVQVYDTGNNVVTADADVTISGNSIVVADGATYNTVEAYVIKWIAFK